MKTQISHLRSGIKKQLLNPEIDYSELAPSTSHTGHAGTPRELTEQVWKTVIQENPGTMKIEILGIQLDLTQNKSLSGKTVTYSGTVSPEDLENKFRIQRAKNRTASISIQLGNYIVVSNGKNEFTHICPSLVKIL